MSTASVTPTHLLVEIRGLYPSLNEQERKVATYALDNPEEVVSMSISDLARAVEVSDATIFRFCKKVGTDGYQDFKIRLARELDSTPHLVYQDITAQDSLEGMAGKVIAAGQKALQDTWNVLDLDQLDRALDAILQAPRLDIFGAGGSGLTARELHGKLLQLGLNARVYQDTETQMISAALLEAGDAAIGISYSGRLRETVETLELARRSGAVTTAITNHPGSPITRVADFVLLTAAPASAGRGDPLSARVAQLALVDVIYQGAILKRYQASQARLSQIAELVHRRRL